MTKTINFSVSCHHICPASLRHTIASLKKATGDREGETHRHTDTHNKVEAQKTTNLERRQQKAMAEVPHENAPLFRPAGNVVAERVCLALRGEQQERALLRGEGVVPPELEQHLLRRHIPYLAAILIDWPIGLCIDGIDGVGEHITRVGTHAGTG